MDAKFPQLPEVEAREYRQPLSEKEVEVLRSQLIELSGNLIFFREVPFITPDQLRVCFQRLSELMIEKEQCNVLLDISRSNHVDAETRELIKDLWSPLKDKIDRFHIITGENLFVHVSAKFISAGLGIKECFLFKTWDEAIKAF